MHVGSPSPFTLPVPRERPAPADAPILPHVGRVPTKCHAVDTFQAPTSDFITSRISAPGEAVYRYSVYIDAGIVREAAVS